MLQRPCLSFFALTWFWSWSVWFLVALVPQSLPGRIGLYVGAFGPVIAAAVMTKVQHGSLRDWAQRIITWRVAPQWYLFAFGFPMLFALAVTGIYALSGHVIDLSLLLERLPQYLPLLGFNMILGGGHEEPGWRGYALAPLQQRFGPIRATLLLGLIWALWHLPLLVANPNAAHSSIAWSEILFPALITMASIILYAFWYSWLYNRTRNILLCILLHASFNTSNMLLILVPKSAVQGATYQTLLWISFSILLVSVIALLVATQGRLGQTKQPTTPSLNRIYFGENL
jgi:membrane protease YdiL (CAAX protease family)